MHHLNHSGLQSTHLLIQQICTDYSYMPGTTLSMKDTEMNLLIETGLCHLEDYKLNYIFQDIFHLGLYSHNSTSIIVKGEHIWDTLT